MTLRLTENEFKLLRDFIEDQYGIMLGDNKAYLIENRLSDLAEKCGCLTFGEFYLKVKNSSERYKLRTSLADAITTSETSWFRDQPQFRILQDRVFTEFRHEIKEGRRQGIDIWSAACSTGEEPYSIAFSALDFYRATGGEGVCREQVKILATDISSTCLPKAIKGEYDNASIDRGLPKEYLDRYFQKMSSSWIVKEEVRKMISFKQFNLRDPLMGFGPFDIIFLRNVAIYFSDQFKKTLFNRITRLLSPGGYLFLGTGEVISSYSTAFDILNEKGAIFYILKHNMSIDRILSN